MARSTRSLKQTVTSEGMQLSPGGSWPPLQFWGTAHKDVTVQVMMAVLLPLSSSHKLIQVPGRGSQGGLTELLVSKPNWDNLSGSIVIITLRVWRALLSQPCPSLMGKGSQFMATVTTCPFTSEATQCYWMWMSINRRLLMSQRSSLWHWKWSFACLLPQAEPLFALGGSKAQNVLRKLCPFSVYLQQLVSF